MIFRKSDEVESRGQEETKTLHVCEEPSSLALVSGSRPRGNGSETHRPEFAKIMVCFNSEVYSNLRTKIIGPKFVYALDYIYSAIILVHGLKINHRFEINHPCEFDRIDHSNFNTALN